MHKTDNHKGIQPINPISETILFEHISKIVEKRRNRAAACVTCETAMMFWETGHFINITLPGDNRAEYGKRIFSAMPGKLSGGDYV
jgi:hypothetical protein